MKPGRLQKINNILNDTEFLYVNNNDVWWLVRALEQAQSELVDALKYRDINLSNFQKENKLTADLRKQLDEVSNG